MATPHLSRTRTTWLAGLTLGLGLTCSAWAQIVAPAAAMPTPDPAAEKALQQHFQSLLTALEGKSNLPDAKNFTDDFNQQVNAGQLKQVFDQVHQTVGNCRVAGQLKGPVSFVSSYLLQCDKGFVPMDIAIEDKVPYRMHSVLIRPPYNKM